MRATLFMFSVLSICLNAQEPAPAPEYNWRDKTIPEAPAPAAIRVNSVGFTPDAAKAATVTGTQRAFEIQNLDTHEVVLKGTSTGQFTTAATDTGGETLSIIDLSAVRAPGHYRISVEGLGTSAPFALARDVWNEPLRTTVRGLYLWRCGAAVDAEFNGYHYHHDACHMEDGYLDLAGGPAGARLPSTGGWHDAGDYNKYVVNAGVSVGLLFKAWEQFRPALEHLALGIPESGGSLPDFLAELKFEYDWLFTMQAEDGRVYHKISAEKFTYWGPPDKDTDRRYVSPWGTAATADFAAMMALGARHFREFDKAYADRCLAAAQRAWAFLATHPEDHRAELSAFHTGTYDCADASHRLWAAAELWETTGQETVRKEFERLAAPYTFSFGGPGWGDVHDLALGTYVLSKREGRDAALVSRLKAELLSTAEKIVQTAQGNAHARPFGVEANTFSWGCNSTVAGQTFQLFVANLISPKPEYRSTAADALGHLFGRNYHGRSYVTGLGYQPPEHAHDRRGTPQLPGYLVGGPWPTARHWFDQVLDPSRNEIAINWNAALIYALAAFATP